MVGGSWSRLPALSSLRHTYIALRHGQSTANVAGVISSDPQVATITHGLTDLGQQQAANAAELLAALPIERAVFLTSDYTRARETAAIAAERLSRAWMRDVPIIPELRLRERWFGNLDGSPDQPGTPGSLGGYHAVWDGDAVDASVGVLGCEPVASVLERSTSVVADIEAGTHPYFPKFFPDLNRTDEENQPSGVGVVLVAHGDILQIMQTAFEETITPSQHRSLPHLDNASPRLLNHKCETASERK